MLCAFKLNEYFYSVVKPYCRKKANSLKKKNSRYYPGMAANLIQTARCYPKTKV